MKLNSKLTIAWLAMAAGWMSFQQAAAAPVSVDLGTIPGAATTAGTFSDQGEVLEAMFSVTSNSDVTLFTTSYASGGFQPQNNPLYQHWQLRRHAGGSVSSGSCRSKHEPSGGCILI